MHKKSSYRVFEVATQFYFLHLFSARVSITEISIAFNLNHDRSIILAVLIIVYII